MGWKAIRKINLKTDSKDLFQTYRPYPNTVSFHYLKVNVIKQKISFCYIVWLYILLSSLRGATANLPLGGYLRGKERPEVGREEKSKHSKPDPENLTKIATGWRGVGVYSTVTPLLPAIDVGPRTLVDSGVRTQSTDGYRPWGPYSVHYLHKSIRLIKDTVLKGPT